MYGNGGENLATNDNCFEDYLSWGEWVAIKFSSKNLNSYRDYSKITLLDFQEMEEM